MVSGNELIKSSLECRDYVDEAKDFYLLPERRSSIEPTKLRGRCCKELVGHIYIIGGLTSAGDSVNSVELFDCATEVILLSKFDKEAESGVESPNVFQEMGAWSSNEVAQESFGRHCP